MRPRRCAALAVFASMLGCGPEIPAAWQIVDVLDLGVQVHVEELGPLGDPGDPMGRHFHDAMPLDRVRASVMVAGLTWPVLPEDVAFSWYVCPGTACASDLPPDPCPEDGLRLTQECTLGIQSEARFSFADFDGRDDALALATGSVTLRAIGGLRSDGGAEVCLDRIARATDLGACMIVEAYYPLGSLGEILALAERRGLTGLDDTIPDAARQFPRNRVPAVESLELARDSGVVETVLPGATVSATVGESLTFTWIPGKADREEVTSEGSDGTSLEYIDPLSAMWWTTQRADAFDFVPTSPSVRWDVGADEGTFPLYVVVTDGGYASGWASFAVEVTP